IEVEKRAQEADRPPLLPAPISSAGETEAKKGDGTAAWGKDPTLQAMADEMARSRSQLKMDQFAPPYFVAYTAQDRESVTIAATMGALLDSSHDAGRQLWADVRVGDATSDNTNFLGRGAGFDAPDGLPEEARYDTDRRAIWLATDDAYKQAI